MAFQWSYLRRKRKAGKSLLNKEEMLSLQSSQHREDYKKGGGSSRTWSKGARQNWHNSSGDSRDNWGEDSWQPQSSGAGWKNRDSGNSGQQTGWQADNAGDDRSRTRGGEEDAWGSWRAPGNQGDPWHSAAANSRGNGGSAWRRDDTPRGRTKGRGKGNK